MIVALMEEEKSIQSFIYNKDLDLIKVLILIK